MMRIHTTQNLSSTINEPMIPTLQQQNYNLSTNMSYLASSVSFGRKKPDPKKLKPIIDEVAKKAIDVKDKARPELSFWDKILDSKFFNGALSIAENETLVNAIMAFLICAFLRPGTMLLMQNDDNKKSIVYQAAHSFASGATGLTATLLLIQPFKNGANLLMDKSGEYFKELKEETLQRLYPHLDMKSIKDASGKRKPVTEWVDTYGNKFTDSFKDVEKIPAFKKFADIAAETYKKLLNVDVDWASQNGKSFNEIVTKSGKPLYDVIDWKKIGIVANSENGKDVASVLLRDLDKDFLKKLIENAPAESNWKKLDVESVYDKAGKVVDFRKWKQIGSGEQWKLDLDTAYISSPLDEISYTLRVSGKTRFHEKDQEEKYISYLKNGVNGELGTPVTQEFHNSSVAKENLDKLVTWIADIVFRPVVAYATIAIIPWVLKNIFHLEKPKKKLEKEEKVADSVQTALNENNIDKKVSFKGRQDSLPNDIAKSSGENNISFKGKLSGKIGKGFIARFLAKYYAKPLYESKRLYDICKKMINDKHGMTQHMTVLGSAITSGVYVGRTLTNDDLEKEPRRTLAISQFLCFVIPTIMAYVVDNALRNKTKNIEYRYSHIQEHKMALANFDGREADVKLIKEKLNKRLKGVRVILSLLTFTLIYRYITPVIITPVANKLGDKYNAWKRSKTESVASSNEEAITVKMNTEEDKKSTLVASSNEEAITVKMNTEEDKKSTLVA